MADTQEKVASDASLDVSNQEEEKVTTESTEENVKPKRGRKSGPKRSSIAKIQEEAQGFTKGLPGTEVEGRRMTRSAVRGPPPPVTPSPPPKRERKSPGASGGGGRGGKRGRQRKIEKEDGEEEEEDEEGEQKAKTPKKAEENGDDVHGDDDEDAVQKKDDVKKEDGKMEVDDSKPDEASNDDKIGEGKPVVNNSDLEPASSASEVSEPKEEEASEGTSSGKPVSDDCKVNNVDSKVAEEDVATAGKAVNDNSLLEEEGNVGDDKTTSEETASAKVVPQESEPVPVPVSQ